MIVPLANSLPREICRRFGRWSLCRDICLSQRIRISSLLELRHHYIRCTLCAAGSDEIWTYLRHPSIHHKVGPIDEAAFIAGEEEHGLGLLNGFTESTRRKVDFAAVPLSSIVAEPVLKEGSTV